MLVNIIGMFFLLAFGIVLINVGMWVRNQMLGIEDSEVEQKERFKGTIIIFIIFYIIYIVGEIMNINIIDLFRID